MTTLQKKIRQNQRFHKYTKILRQIRLRVFDYEDQGKLDKAHRIIGKIKKICEPTWRASAKRNEDRLLRTWA